MVSTEIQKVVQDTGGGNYFRSPGSEVVVSYRDGGLKINFLERSIRMDGSEIQLYPQAFKILWFLIQNRGKKIVYHKELLGAISGGENGSMDSLKWSISRLHKEIGEWRIKNIFNKGYHWMEMRDMPEKEWSMEAEITTIPSSEMPPIWFPGYFLHRDDLAPGATFSEILRNTGEGDQGTFKEYRNGTLIVDVRGYAVYLDERKVTLRPGEFLILVYLITHRERVVSHRELTDKALGGQSLETVKDYVSRIRKKVGKERISTVIRVGYRWTEEPGTQQTENNKNGKNHSEPPVDTANRVTERWTQAWQKQALQVSGQVKIKKFANKRSLLIPTPLMRRY